MAMNENDWDAQWQQRYEPAQLSSLENALQQALHWESLRAQNSQAESSNEYSLLWRLARLAHFRAMQADDTENKKEAMAQFEHGAQYALTATQRQPHEVEGHFWRGVNVLEAARRRGTLAAMQVLPLATRHLERAMNIDEAYHFAGPLRALGRLTHLRPLLLGGSIERAMDFYKRALQVVPGNSTTLLYYAEALLADQQRRAARRVLARIIEAADDPDWRWEQARDRRLAQALLEKLQHD